MRAPSSQHQIKNPSKQKHVDKWWKLKGKGIDTGKIHLGLHRLGLHQKCLTKIVSTGGYSYNKIKVFVIHRFLI